MLTVDETASAVHATQEWLRSDQTDDDELDKALAALLTKAFLAGYKRGHTAAQNPPTNDANASYLPRLDDKPDTFQLVGDRVNIRVTNPQGGQQTDVHIVANPGAIAIGLSHTDQIFARTILFAPWE